ncbi:hypothetical protein MRS44_003780 [Fusarium solani]|uniref:uncharacterized protein n=1 Tax=Fusarium solani TaxID=169388 RepID=UPI0032C451FA|nr:hypothetical protein MRS44_003780 [Fusarium solani]
MAPQFSDADHETLSAAENSKRITLPDRQPIATEFPETAAVLPRHSAGSQSKSVPAVVTQVSSRKLSPEAIEDCDGMEGFVEDTRSPVKEKTPAPVTRPLSSDIRTVLSPEADATIVESCEKTTDQTEELWPSSTCSHFPVFAFQIRTVLSTCPHFPVFAFQIRTVPSLEADATIVESCENTTELTSLLWPSSTCPHFPVFAFQIRTVLSSEADATIVESCENTTDLTSLLWPSSTCPHFPGSAFQIRTVLSTEADATIVESCENTTE